jgi:hypothetical protein
MTAAASGARPAISAQVPARGARVTLGLRGLTLIVPIAVLLAIGAGGAEPSLLVLGPLVTASLPVLIMVAFWWEDWPGTRLGPNLAGWADTLLIAAGGVGLTAAAQAVAGGLDLRGMFLPAPGAGHVPTFPVTLPLAAAAFTVMLEFTLVGEGWPLRRLPALVAGPLALALSWAAALALYLALVRVSPPAGSGITPRSGPVPAAEFGSALVWIGVWQALCFVVWRGRPSSRIASRRLRLACGHAIVLCGGLASYLLVRLVTGPASATAAGGCMIAAALVVGMLFEAGDDEPAAAGLAVLVLAAGLFALLSAVAGGLRFSRARPEDWVAHASLNALTVSILLHVAVGRRWPFGRAR